MKFCRKTLYCAKIAKLVKELVEKRYTASLQPAKLRYIALKKD